MRDAIYRELAEEFGASLERFASGWERDPDRRRDLVQEIHVALWRSLERWNGDCSRREVVLLYLEGMDAAGIAEVTGLSASNVATKIFRLKRALGGEQGTGRHAG